MNSSTWLRASIVALLLWQSADAPIQAAGVTQVTATSRFLYIHGETGTNAVRVFERDAWETARLPERDQPLERVAAPAVFDFAVPRFVKERDRLYSAFQALEELPDGTLQPLGFPRYVGVWRGISACLDPFPPSTSKKGLQVQMINDALELGIHHAALNFNLGQMIDVHRNTESITSDFGGERFYFHPNYLEHIDRDVKSLSDAGVVVSLILLAYQSGDQALDRVLLHPKYNPACPNHLGAFNSVTPDGAKYFAAAIEFLGNRYCTSNSPSGRVSNFILGNEVNSHWFWSNRGACSMEDFAEDYLRAVRIANTAIRKASVSARVYVSLEHHWNIRYPGGNAQQAFAGRDFLEYFHRRAQEEGDFDWHVAFHPYPENLFDCRTWLDRTATESDDTPRITFKNIEILTGFLGRSSWQYSPPPNESYGLRTRRIILSEQGFHAKKGEEGELWQAAAYAYAYRKIATNRGIDSFILHRHVDHSQEGGLNLGLWTRKEGSIADPDRKRKIYEVFKQADQLTWKTAFEFALPVIGVMSWE